MQFEYAANTPSMVVAYKGIDGVISLFSKISAYSRKIAFNFKNIENYFWNDVFYDLLRIKMNILKKNSYKSKKNVKLEILKKKNVNYTIYFINVSKKKVNFFLTRNIMFKLVLIKKYK